MTHRQEALRRLGDLEMDRVDNLVGAGERQGTPEDYKAAIARYRAFLAAYPTAAGNDRVLYQLARAQELSGDLDAALKTLTQLVDAIPARASWRKRSSVAASCCSRCATTAAPRRPTRRR